MRSGALAAHDVSEGIPTRRNEEYAYRTNHLECDRKRREKSAVPTQTSVPTTTLVPTVPNSLESDMASSLPSAESA